MAEDQACENKNLVEGDVADVQQLPIMLAVTEVSPSGWMAGYHISVIISC
jgi:hypothetical protein